MNSLKIVQLNMGRGAIVNDQLVHFCQNNNEDIALIQEPYTRRGLLVGLETAPLRTQLCPGEHRRNNIIHGSGIVVFNPHLKVLAREDLTTENFTVMSVEMAGNQSITLISAYFKFRVPTNVHITALGNIIDKLDGDYIIGADVNAFSRRWFSRITDGRGETVEEFIDQNHLICHNKTSRFRTFTGARGSTNIDVTLSSPGLDRVEEWDVIIGETSSDHAIISFEINLCPTKGVKRPKRFAEHKADWLNFTSALQMSLTADEYTLANGSIDERASSITKCIKQAAIKSIPLRRSVTKLRPPWWTNDLVEKRRALKAAARKRYVDHNDYALKQAFRTARNNFTSQLRKEKRMSWRDHCTSEGKYVWGNLYKWLKKGTTPAKIPTGMKLPDGSFTTSMDDTITHILNTLIPNDPNLFCEIEELEGNHDYVPCTIDEVRSALWRTSPRKAPGNDSITAGIARKAWPLIGNHLCDLANSCLRSGLFPSSWKSADVTIIKKAIDNDDTLVKSYRPISLLPVLAKTLEKVICDRLLNETTDQRSPNKHGFVKDKSTQTAIHCLLDWHRNSPNKYTLAAFLDISGAFDNLDWNVLHQDLQLLGCSDSTRAITRSYLHCRTASLNSGGVKKTIGLTRGCPQGSLFGPVLWNVTMERLLKLELPEYAFIQAYADDIALSVSANNRKELQIRSAEILDLILHWGAARKLNFSSIKSVAVPFKGNLTPGFTIQFGNERIVTKSSAKYLGIVLDSKLDLKNHVESLRSKSLDIFTRMRGIFGADWGMKRENARILYNCVFLPRVLYEVQFWHNTTARAKKNATLNVLQRRSLLGITSAYRTAATESLQVIAGTLPLDLEASLQVANLQSKNLPPEERLAAVERNRETAILKWQDRWDVSTKGRWTHSLIPDVGKRLKTPMWTNHHIVQFLSGHGDFRAKLSQFNLVENPFCVCGQGEETTAHVIFDCPIVDVPRKRLELEVLRSGHLWPCSPETLLSSGALYSAFDRFAGEALEGKKLVRP